MKFSSSIVFASLLAANLSSVQAFAPSPTISIQSQQYQPSTRLYAASDDGETQDKVAALRAAAAKAREDADRLSQELGKSPTAAAVAEKPKKDAQEIKSMVSDIMKETDPAKQAEQWNSLKEYSSAFGKANLRTYPVGLEMLERRAGLTSASLGIEESDVSLDDFKYATLWVTGGASVGGIASLALLPPNVGATACYFFAILPILFLALGSSAPGFIAEAIVKIRGSEDDGVSRQDRICRHEAAHFCCGYWCGLPIQSYSVNEGVAQVEFGAGGSKLSNTEVAALSVTALSGLVGEARKWEKAVGAENDLMTLDNVFRQSDEFIGASAQQDLTRWGALTASNLLIENSAQYEQVVDAFRQGKSVEECIAILESA